MSALDVFGIVVAVNAATLGGAWLAVAAYERLRGER